MLLRSARCPAGGGAALALAALAALAALQRPALLPHAGRGGAAAQGRRCVSGARQRRRGPCARRSFELSVSGGLEVEVSAAAGVLDALPALAAAAAAAAGLAAAKGAVDGPPELELSPGCMLGRTVVVTGGSSGLGFEAAARLARAGATVVATARTGAKALEALASLRAAAAGAGEVHVLALDLADLRSVRAFAEELRRQPYGGKVDVLVNNAGVMAVPEFGTTADGFETQLGVNHLGHFALTGLLLPLLSRAADGARVVSVSSSASLLSSAGSLSEAARSGGCAGGYSAWPAYAASKLANVVFAKELDRRFRAAGLRATAVSLHPGVCPTELARFVVSGEDRPLQDVYAATPPPLRAAMQGMRGALRPVSRGANTHVYLAAGADGGYDCSGGEYFEDMRPAQAQGDAGDPALGRLLWEESERLTGVYFDFAAAAAGGARGGAGGATSE